MRRVVIAAAIAMSAAAAVASPAIADPNPFGTLGCSCQPPALAPPGKAPATDGVNQGIRNGLGYLHGVSPHPNDF